MSVPGFQDFLLPFLLELEDAKEHQLDQVADAVAARLKLSDEDRKETIPSGNQRKFENRVGWARTYLKKSGLIESVGRGRFKITTTGSGVLANKPTKIDMKFLEQFPGYQEFRKTSYGGNGKKVESALLSTETPLESLDQAYQAIRKELAEELLERVKKCTPLFFEQLVVDLLVAMGYGGSRIDAGKRVGQKGDGGIDGIIDEDKLGLDVVCIQAKKWTNGTVGRPDIQAFAGSLEERKAKKGVFITTTDFSKEAYDFVKNIEKRIVLINGERLTELMIDHGVGVSEVTRYLVKKADLDYFAGGLE